jgi:low temperature requirement protein LtrA
VSEQQDERVQRVSPLELFFDLVFAFAFTQVTTVLSDNATWSGLGHAALILAVLWWAWAAYAWLTNTVDPGIGPVWGALLVSIAALFVAALAVPGAFGDDGVVFGVAFLVVCAMQLTLYALGARRDRDLLGAILRVAPHMLAGAVLILVAGFVDGALRALLWLAALAIGYFGPLVENSSGWRVAPAHFVERHGLIVIIAIGESLVAIGVGTRGVALSAGEVVVAVLALAVSSSFWVCYFDFFPMRGEQMLADRTGAARAALARDVYTYGHLPMVAGIVLFAFGSKVTLAHPGDELGTVEALCLCGGSALFLAAFPAIRLRIAGTIGRGRSTAALACAALVPVATAVPAVAALALVVAVWVALNLYELVWWREQRAEARALRA